MERIIFLHARSASHPTSERSRALGVVHLKVASRKKYDFFLTTCCLQMRMNLVFILLCARVLFVSIKIH